MIRINLLGVDRRQTRRTAVFDIGKRITLACSMILVVAAAGVGLWFWSLTRTSSQLDADIAEAQSEITRLRGVVGEVTKFEERRAQLEQRVGLIQELRKGQSMPVRLLDEVSRSVPDMMWLTAMEQKASEVTIEGRSTTLIGLSDFVANLGSSDFFKKPIEILDSQVEAAQAGSQGTGVELIQFKVKAQLTTAPSADAAGGRPGAPRK
jgi:type IV pilus assembly protein PilN